MNIYELIKEKLEESKRNVYEYNHSSQYEPTETEVVDYEDAILIVDEVAKEYPKTPTPDHPIPIDTQQYIEELEKQVKEARNKAIDDFAYRCKENLLCRTFGLHPNNIDEIAEQLKDGV